MHKLSKHIDQYGHRLVSDMLFNPDFALWSYSSINQMCMQINPSSGIANDEHLRYFHFTGRLLGKALFDRQIVAGHLVRPLSFHAASKSLTSKLKSDTYRYKHILGWPLTVADLEQLDADTYANLCKLKDLDDVEVCCLDFTVTEDHWGTAQTVELKSDGANCTVTNSNVDDYIQLQMRYRLLDRVKEQVKALLIGFYDVVPEVIEFVIEVIIILYYRHCSLYSISRSLSYYCVDSRKLTLRIGNEIQSTPVIMSAKVRHIKWSSGSGRSWSTILTRSIRPDFFSLLPVPQECPHRASVRFKEMTIIYANLQSTLFQRQYRSSPRHILVSTASIYHCMIQRRS